MSFPFCPSTKRFFTKETKKWLLIGVASLVDSPGAGAGESLLTVTAFVGTDFGVYPLMYGLIAGENEGFVAEGTFMWLDSLMDHLVRFAGVCARE